MGRHDKALTQEQQKKVDALRAKGKPIRAIARELHIDDKRVSAYLKKRCESKKCNCKIVGKAKPAYVAKKEEKPLDSLLEFFGLEASDDVCKLTSALTQLIIYVANTLQDGDEKEFSPKKMHEEMNKVYDAFTEAVSTICAATIMAMPKKFKEFWIANVHNEPTSAKKKAKK